MRTLERLIVVLLLPAVLWSFHPALPAWFRLFAVLAAILIPIHAWLEGMHWQMVPAYIAAAILLLCASGIVAGEPARLICAIGSCLLLMASLTFSWVLPMFNLPLPTGKYPVGTRMLRLVDVNRAEMHARAKPGNREVVVQLWYPSATAKGRKAKYRQRNDISRRSSYQAVLASHSLQDAPMAIGRFPIIVHNPAWHDSCCRETFMMQELASHGFVVAAVSHPYNSSRVELSDGSIAYPNHDQDLGFSLRCYIPLHERLALAEEELAIHTADCRFVLDELARFDQTVGHPLEGRLLMDRVAGHGISFGGAVAMELANEDARVCSAVGLDGVLHGSVAVHGLDKPFLFIDSRWMVTPDEVDANANIRDIETTKMWKDIADLKTNLLSRCGGMRVIVEGIGHADFSDQIFMSPLRRLSHAGVVPPKQVARIINAYCVAFFRQTLCNHEEEILAAGAQTFSEATLSIGPQSIVDTSTRCV
jgi:hypothetical protein